MVQRLEMKSTFDHYLITKMEVVNRPLSIKKCRLPFCLFVYVMGIVTKLVSTGGAHKKYPSGLGMKETQQLLTINH